MAVCQIDAISFSGNAMENPVRATIDPCSIVVMSPHFDDAVFSCGQLLSAVSTPTVVTVFTACPTDGGMLTDWDERCGFADAANAMQARRAENDHALSVLQAKGIDLDFLDAQYPQIPHNNAELLIDTLASTVSQLQPSTVVFPLGLFHSDHIRVSDALITLSPRFDTIRWIAYEDIPYCRQTACVADRVTQLAQRNIQTIPISPHPATGVSSQLSDIKERAVNAYKSQFQGLKYDDAQPIMQLTERYWQLHASMELL